MLPNTYYLGNVVIIGIYSILVIGLCLLMGFAGQVSLGHAAFYGLGAYGSGLLTAKLAWAPFPAMLAAALLTAGVALVIGLITLRLKEQYLALATLGAGVIIFNEQVIFGVILVIIMIFMPEGLVEEIKRRYCLPPSALNRREFK